MKKIICITGLLLSVCSTFVYSGVPTGINYQGRYEESGSPVTGTRVFRFKIYDAEVGGNLLWDSGDVSLSVVNGLFNYVLDCSNIDWKNKTPYLEVSVGGTVLSPREKIQSSPYAFYSSSASYADNAGLAENANKLGGQSPSYYLDTSATAQTKSGDLTVNNLYVGNNVGIGTTSPGSKLEVYQGNIAITRPSGDTSSAVLWLNQNNATSGGKYAIAARNTGEFAIYDGTAAQDRINVYPSSVDPSAGTAAAVVISSSCLISSNLSAPLAHPTLYLYEANTSKTQCNLFMSLAAPNWREWMISARSTSMLYGGSTLNGTGILTISAYDPGPTIRIIEISTAGVAIQGNLNVTGTISKGGGTFEIDHPLDPENKILRHSFVESPDMKTFYDGVVTLDDNGEATVKLPDYFEALNMDYRYQLTTIGKHAPVYIKSEIKNNEFKIASANGAADKGVKVCWQVTGIRHDPFALANPIIVESEKSEEEKGTYLHPDAYQKIKKIKIPEKQLKKMFKD